MATKLLRKPAVLDRVLFSPSTLHRKIKDGSFPSPVKVGERVVAWRKADLIAWEESLPVVQSQAGRAA
jgi:prophage regulatory protein